MIRPSLYACMLALILTGLLPCSAHAVNPDQVLVLYNKDWTIDSPGTDPGQDSEEVARYYVARHTDPDTGKKPYILGISCSHTKQDRRSRTQVPALHLNGENLSEESGDNRLGTVYTGKNPLTPEELKKQRYYLVSSHIEARLNANRINTASVVLKVGRTADEKSAVTVFADEKSWKPDTVMMDTAPGRGRRKPDPDIKYLRFNAKKAGFSGDLYVWLYADDKNGKQVLKETRRYFDPEHFKFSRTGPDGIPDDKNYLEDVAGPVKAFLEDPKNAVNGTLLKDHILYIVLSYGFPRTVTRFYGIRQTAVPTSMPDSGFLVSLNQRVETLYYDFEAAEPPSLMPVHFGYRGRIKDKPGLFLPWTLVSGYWLGTMGRDWQPYLYHTAYLSKRTLQRYITRISKTEEKETDPKRKKELASKKKEYSELMEKVSLPWKPPPHFTPEHRKTFPKRFLYLCSCLDMFNPHNAKHQVDAAIYGSRYLTPSIGSRPEGEWSGEKALAAAETKAGTEELKTLGFPGCGKSINHSAYFGRRENGGYFPGAVEWYVISGNSCGGGQVRRHLRERVSVTGGAARSYSGCPHTTTHGWWDCRVFYHFLFRGYDLGEAWLLSKFKISWSTVLFGDPLYRPDLRNTRFDRTPPKVSSKDDIKMHLMPSGKGYCAVLTARLHTSPDNPEMALTAAEYWKKGNEKTILKSEDPWYRSRPRVLLHSLEPDTSYCCRLVLTDPYLNTFDSKTKFGDISFRTGPSPGFEPTFSAEKPGRVPLEGKGGKKRLSPSQGEIHLTLAARGGGWIFRCGDLSLRQHGSTIYFNPGGGVIGNTGYPKGFKFEDGRTYTIIARFRDYPVTREVWLKAADNSLHLLCADNISPWTGMDLYKEISFLQPRKGKQGSSVLKATMYDRSHVRSAESRIRFTFNREAFEKADRHHKNTVISK